jgi:hypothetical protein
MLGPAERLAGFAVGWDGSWSLLNTARRAALALAALPGLDDELAFTEAGWICGEAVEVLE